jgi:signal transduction histidine kinase
VDVTRLGAVGVVAVTGVGIVVPNALAVTTSPLAALVVTLLGTVLGLALVAAAGLLYWSDVSTPHALRVAGWNTLGVVVLGLVLLLATGYPGVSLPTPIAASILGVSAVAHVLIGVTDVLRIRAGELAQERRKLSAINRLARHNLRNETQVLLSAADIVDEKLAEFQEAVGRGSVDGTVDIAAVVAGVAAEYREASPDAEFETSVPEGLHVRATPHIEVAVAELLENALEHGDGAEVGVEIRAHSDGEQVSLTVSDGGPGIPEREWQILVGEREQTQLEHATGLGLWVVKSVAESFGGEFDRTEGDPTLRLQRA